MMSEKLSSKQSRFLWNLAKMIVYGHAQGYDITLGRGLETPAGNKANGGIAKSNHLSALAQDLNFFKGGQYLTKTEDLKIFGDWWKNCDPCAVWGGDFTKPDGNHFSFSHEGVK
jgi:hypothetical protein